MSSPTFIKNSNIDLKKWDDCIARSQQQLPYAFSWYLNAVAENWDALVVGDYEVVMPVVWLRKFGIKCLYQPYYCQQLGFFSQKPVSKNNAESLLGFVNSEYAYANINLNPSAKIVAEKFRFTTKKNLLLLLNSDYNSIRKKYSENHKRNIARAQKNELEFLINTDINSFREFYLENINRVKENFKPKHEKILYRLTNALLENKLCQIASVTQKGKTVAASLVISYGKRYINIINTSSAEGKQKGASHFLFDRFIAANTGKNHVFDFEGSSIPSIARFYEGFGGREELFYQYKNSISGTLKQRFL